jgi:NAD-dependent dihydropyrimidine dehydrogenase PreA subunit
MNHQLQQTAFHLGKLDRRTLNITTFFISLLVFGTGLILFTQFHIGDGEYRKEWLGFDKIFWLVIHQATAIAFLVGFVLHILDHRKYIRKVAERWRINLPRKIKSRTREQILLFIVAIVVMWAGFYPWIVMPEATLEVEIYHSWIDIHNRVGIVFLMGLFIHIARRWRRIFRLDMRNNISKSKAIKDSAAKTKNHHMQKKTIGSRNNNRTKYISAETTKCEACWICIDECKCDTLGKVNIWFHKHIVIENADECYGCKKCVAICPNGVFEPVTQSKTTMNY